MKKLIKSTINKEQEVKFKTYISPEEQVFRGSGSRDLVGLFVPENVQSMTSYPITQGPGADQRIGVSVNLKSITINTLFMQSLSNRIAAPVTVTSTATVLRLYVIKRRNQITVNPQNANDYLLQGFKLSQYDTFKPQFYSLWKIIKKRKFSLKAAQYGSVAYLAATNPNLFQNQNGKTMMNMQFKIKLNRKVSVDQFGSNLLPELNPKDFYYIYYISSCSPYPFPGDVNDPQDGAAYVHNVRSVSTGILKFTDS